MLTSTEEDMPEKRVFQQDGDIKHTSKLAKSCFLAIKMNVMERLIPIKNLWRDIKNGYKIL